MIQTKTAVALKSHTLFSTYISSQNLALHVTMWRNMMGSNNISGRMRIKCRINKATIRTLRIVNNCFFSSSTTFRATRPNIRLHIMCLYCHTLITHDTTPLRFTSNQKCNIAYGCCQLGSIFHWFPKLNAHSSANGFVIESYKFSCKVCELYLFELSNFNDGNIPINYNYQNRNSRYHSRPGCKEIP